MRSSKGLAVLKRGKAIGKRTHNRFAVGSGDRQGLALVAAEFKAGVGLPCGHAVFPGGEDDEVSICRNDEIFRELPLGGIGLVVGKVIVLEVER